MLVGQLGIEPSAELRRLEQQVLQQDPALEVAGRPLRGFQLLEQVGDGAFGVVHRAAQPQVGREVAVKLVRPSLANDPEFIRRFEAEAQLVARLEHPHIVPLYDYWREPDGAYLVMRLMRGGSLRDALEGGPLSLEAALLVVDQVGAALASAHRQGVVHRDVKPGNILFDEEGNAYLSDFGIARDVSTARTPDRAAATTTSAEYVSPEELRGDEPSARADVYSLGRILHAMVDGELPGGVEAIVRRATSLDPDDRYADASDLVGALAGAAPPAAPAGPAGPARNPYKGLRPFLEPDAPDFRGRESLVARLVERLAGDGPGARLLALVGPSGSGKSSAVRAGLVPALRAGAVPGSERWFVAELAPGEEPFGELAAALVALAPAPPAPDLAGRIERDPEALAEAAAALLPDDDSELLLVIDQFEELFTLVADEDRRAAFLAALRWAATDSRSRVRTVLTLRADFFDRPLAHAGFAEILRAGTELVLPLSADELERAIAGPAERIGASVEGGLLAELVSDASGQPGALPLLQFTLAELFDRRRDGVLTLSAYRELGGVGGAVARGAEEIHAALSEPRRQAARELFLRLVDHREVARRRVLRSEVVSLGEEMEAVIGAFAARRLLSFDRDPETREPTVEIAHDALLGAWDRLRDWLEAAREGLRSPDGRSLAIASFDAGGVVVDIASGDVVFELKRQDGVSDIDWSPDGRWITTASFDSSIQVWDARDGRARFTLSGHKGEVVAADWSPDSRRLATGSNDGTAKVWEVAPGGVQEALSISAQERGGGLWVAFSPDGERLMTGDQGVTAVKIWDVGPRGGAEWANVPVAAGPTGGVAFSADGRRVVAAPTGATITVADAQTGESAIVLRGFPDETDAASIAVSREGTLAAAVGHTVRTWNLDSRREGYSTTPRLGRLTHSFAGYWRDLAGHQPRRRSARTGPHICGEPDMNHLVNQRTAGISALALLVVTGAVILSGGENAHGNHPNPLSVRPQCPKGALELPGDALIGATRAALKEASIVYRAKDRKGMKARNAHFEDLYRSGYAAATCGKRAHKRTVVVGLFFPAERPSASLSTGVVMVSLFRDGYHVWAVKR